MKAYTVTLKNTIQQFLIITMVFILVGSLFNFWHLWFLYLIPSVMLFKQNGEKPGTLTMIHNSFFIVTTIYLATGMILDIWHPTWLVYLLPIIFFLNRK